MRFPDRSVEVGGLGVGSHPIRLSHPGLELDIDCAPDGATNEFGSLTRPGWHVPLERRRQVVIDLDE